MVKKMNRIIREAERELFGHPHPSETEIRMQRLGYILKNGHSPQQKHRAYLELQRRMDNMENNGHRLGHYRRALNWYKLSL